MKKLCILLAAVLLLSALTPATAVMIPAPSPWAADGVTAAREGGILETEKTYAYQSPISRKDFCSLIYNYCAKAGKLALTDDGDVFADASRSQLGVRSSSQISTLHAMGIVEGKSETRFAPDDPLTREEAAAILFRLVDEVHPDWAATCLYFAFEDEKAISNWAMSPIQSICNMGIMKGVGKGKFAPKDTFTAEQAIVTVMRVKDAFAPKAVGSTFADRLNSLMPEDKNYLLSPLSIKMALMLAANGAEGATLHEILGTLDVKDLSKYNAETKKLLDSYRQSDLLRLEVANSLWLNTDKTAQRFAEGYKSLLADTFDATASFVTDKNAADAVNGWVSEKTHGKIPAIVDKNNADFFAMLVNAVYFKGRWLNEFSKAATGQDEFTSRNGLKTNVDFMNRRGWIGYSHKDGITTVALPYLTRETLLDEQGNYAGTKRLDLNVSMYLMMADGDFSPEEVLKNTELQSTYMNLSVPKFKVEYSTGLNDLLKTLGIRKAFESGAEFGRMFDTGSMSISSSIHKTYISVDEEGTEAAAVTALGMATSTLPPQPIDVKFNKPFTFVIKDNLSGEILFLGEYAFAE